MSESQKENEYNESEKSSRRYFAIIVIVISVLILAGLGYLGRMWYLDYASEKSGKEIESFISETESSQESTTLLLKDNPVDFDALQKKNSELYAWIKVPGTRVNYPIAQSEDDDFFYLHHDYLKNYLFAGTIYTEMCNSKNFRDPITLVYGHNMYASEGTMFTTLHNFEDQKFFDSHKTFTIYTRGHILTYQIFSVFKYDDRHIMNSFDFSLDNDLAAFQETMLKPYSDLKHVRDGVSLDKDSKVVVLSTCCSGDRSVRFLVCGVLEKDEPTR